VRVKDGDKVVAIFNLSPDKKRFSIESDKLTGAYTNLFTNEKVEFKSIENFELDGRGYMVLEKHE
jgi:hypothetical protein